MNARQLHCAVHAVNKLLATVPPAQLPACISLASTIRKHTGMYALKQAAQFALKDGDKEAESEWGANSRGNCVSIHLQLASTLCSALICRDCGGTLVSCEHINNHSGQTSPTSTENNAPATATCVNKMHSLFRPACTSDRPPLPSTGTSLLPTPPHSPVSYAIPALVMMEQFRAILVLSLSQMGGLIEWVHGEEEEPTKPPWVRELSHLLSPELQHLANLPSHGWTLVSPEAPRTLAAACLWDMHSLTEFDGRMLSGCCHLGCTNFGGCSEAALPTLLCSGCRRVRYCSVQCQRDAWVAGGHASTCRVFQCER